MTIPSRDIGMAPVVIGAGLAGLMTALQLAPLSVVVLAKAPLGEGASSGWAQGGIAAAIGLDDHPTLHLADTLAAGDGLCDRNMVERITAAAPPTSVPGRVPRIMSRGLGILRDHDGLLQALASLLPLTHASCRESDPARVALMVAMAALQRHEGRGAHYRADFPRTDPAVARRSFLTWEAAQRSAQDIVASLPQARSA